MYAEAMRFKQEAEEAGRHPTFSYDCLDRAISKLTELSGWEDADDQISICQEIFERIKAKEIADRMEAEQKEAAREKAERRSKRTRNIISCILIIGIAIYLACTFYIIPTVRRNAAYDMYGETLASAKVGSTIKFGHYEQDFVEANGPEEIEWIVLAKKDDKILVLSKYGLDCKPFDSYSPGWDRSSLRKWLNGDFLDIAFESEESIIFEGWVDGGDNPKYHTYYGDRIKNKVFLLSIDEVEKYCRTKSLRQCVPTDYALGQGAETRVGYQAANELYTGWWWLRSPGRDYDHAACVDLNRTVSYDGCLVENYRGCVRPAMWIELEPNESNQ